MWFNHWKSGRDLAITVRYGAAEPVAYTHTSLTCGEIQTHMTMTWLYTTAVVSYLLQITGIKCTNFCKRPKFQDKDFDTGI